VHALLFSNNITGGFSFTACGTAAPVFENDDLADFLNIIPGLLLSKVFAFYFSNRQPGKFKVTKKKIG
jgi:hypothetical protein